jgi:hypothetical protein
MIPDLKPFPKSWSGGKVSCFAQDFETERIIYVDTDTIITKDLEPIFDYMDQEGYDIGLSLRIGGQGRWVYLAGSMSVVRRIAAELRLNNHIRQTPTGVMFLNGLDPKRMYEEWCEMYRYLEKAHPYLTRGKWSNEVPFAFWLAARYQGNMEKVWDLPHKVHHQLYSRDKYGLDKSDLPFIIHYHQPRRLQANGLGHLTRV